MIAHSPEVARLVGRRFDIMADLYRAKHKGVVSGRSRFVTVRCIGGQVEMMADDSGDAWRFAHRGDPVEWGREVARVLRSEFRWLRGVTFCKAKAAA